MKLKNSNKIFITSFAVILFILAIKFFIFKNNYVKAPLCENGFLDLSSWDFKKYGDVKLKGRWEFYPDVLLFPEDFESKTLLKKMYINVPNSWTREINNNNNLISNKGIGTYKLKIKTNSNFYMYGLITTQINSSYRIFINNKKAAECGKPEISFEKGYSPNVMPSIMMFPSNDNVVEIIIQVANLDYHSGGIIQSIYFGTDMKILDNYLKKTMVNMLSIAFLIMFGIYYLRIYIKGNKEKKLMYFGICCIIYSYIFATNNEKIFNRIFSFIPSMIVLKMTLISISVIIYFISLFIHESNKNFIPQTYKSIITYMISANIILIICIPLKYAGIIENIVGFTNTSICILIATLLASAIINKKYGKFSLRGTLALFCGSILGILQYITYILYYLSIIHSNFIPAISFLFVLVEGSIMLLGQYKKAYSDLETLSNNLVKLSRIKDEVLINTSNEFKTPLTAIVNIAQAIKSEKYKNPLKLEQNLSHIISISTRLSSLVNDIIDFENLQNSSIKFSKKIFDVNASVQMAVDVLGHMKKGDVILLNHVPEGKYYVQADENRLKQIVFHLITNSLKYTEKGYIEIKSENIDNYIYISVVDTGIGIDEETQKRIFSRNVFSKDENFIGEVSSGIGLSISKLLAINMDGDLYLKWSEVNKGSIFILKIPKAENYKSVQKDNLNLGHKSKAVTIDNNIMLDNNENIKKIKLLIVDDEISNIMVLKEIFYEEYYEIIVAYNGKSALELLEKHKDIRIVLLDIMMPGLSGYDVCKKIREKYKLFEIPILLLTVRHTPEEIEAGLEAGANDFLVKPFNSKELKARVKTLMKLKDSVDESLKMETLFLQSQIKPHFLYNSLSVIISLCYSDSERAGKLLGELSNYLRLTFTVEPHNSFVTLEKEISLVKSYIEIEKARFGDRLKAELNIDEVILNEKIPALIIQPIVENSIKHGLMKRNSGGNVRINANKSNNSIKITIEDNGIGINKELSEKLLTNNFSSGIGLKNVNKRLINEYGQGLLISSTINIGTRITINIPLRT